MSAWEILDTGVQSAEENMRLDAELLANAESFSKPILHLYEWEGDSATYGYFTNPSTLLNLDNALTLGLKLARRPTGGGIIFHLWDLAFSVLVPASCPEYSRNTLDNYAFVNNAVLSAAQEFLEGHPPLALTSESFTPWDSHCAHFCMAKPTQYDVMWEGRKIAGAAQRQTKAGFLHQGSIALIAPPRNYLERVLLPGTQVAEAMQAYTCPLLGAKCSKGELDAGKAHLRALLATHLSRSSLSLRS